MTSPVFDFFAECRKVTERYRNPLAVRTEHEHLLRDNISWYHAHGHDWKREKAEHEADPNVGIVEDY